VRPPPCRAGCGDIKARTFSKRVQPVYFGLKTRLLQPPPCDARSCPFLLRHVRSRLARPTFFSVLRLTPQASSIRLSNLAIRRYLSSPNAWILPQQAWLLARLFPSTRLASHIQSSSASFSGQATRCPAPICFSIYQANFRGQRRAVDRPFDLALFEPIWHGLSYVAKDFVKSASFVISLSVMRATRSVACLSLERRALA